MIRAGSDVEQERTEVVRRDQRGRHKGRSVTDRLMAHADYLDRCGRQTLAEDIRFVLGGMKSLAVLCDAHVEGHAKVSPEAIALAAHKFLERPSHEK